MPQFSELRGNNGLQPEEKDQLILQIGSNSPETAVKAVGLVLPDICGVDVNMGCPEKFSTSGGMGSALMKNLENAKAIMKALVDTYGDQISVSCKIRVLSHYEPTLSYILEMQNYAKVHWIAIHPRTAAEKSTVPAKWHMIKKFLETGLITVPILGSGDLFSSKDVQRFLQFTKAHGVIIARGAIHNPAIFRQKEIMLSKEESKEDLEEWKDHFEEKVITETKTIVSDIQETNKVQQTQTTESPPTQENKKKKNDKNRSTEYGTYQDEGSISFSQNLVKVFTRRYEKESMEQEIMEQVREYFRLCFDTANNFQNTKYCILYIFKTHKQHFELFKKLQVGRNFQEYAKLLGMEHLIENGIDCERQQNFEGQYYRKNKHLVDQAEDSEGLIGNKRQSSKLNGGQEVQTGDDSIQQQNKRIKI